MAESEEIRLRDEIAKCEVNKEQMRVDLGKVEKRIASLALEFCRSMADYDDVRKALLHDLQAAECKRVKCLIQLARIHENSKKK
ncbi:MAG: hypothetical protein Q7T16_02335 [Candidatus Burarchaeum sp.]|nr:hypothetical protein [Candidatus Burarchaeum sp.]MDO8339472.1 hypothetical protein [Candidatus Burarchaeum sp.]